MKTAILLCRSTPKTSIYQTSIRTKWTSYFKKTTNFFKPAFYINKLKEAKEVISLNLAQGNLLASNSLFSVFAANSLQSKHLSEKYFPTTVTCSLNFFDSHSNVFKVRNIFCHSLQDVVSHNVDAVRQILDAARKSTSEQPIVRLPLSIRWLIMTMFQTRISEHCGCSPGYFLNDMGVPVMEAEYIFALTYEQSSRVPVKKLRIVLIREELLRKIPQIESPLVEHGYSSARWKTLNVMAKVYQQQKDWLCDETFLEPEEVIKLEKTDVLNNGVEEQNIEFEKINNMRLRRMDLCHIQRIEISLPIVDLSTLKMKE